MNINKLNLTFQSLNKVSISVFSALILIQSSLLRGEARDALRYEYSSEQIKKIESETIDLEIKPKVRLKYLQYNFPISGEISTYIENALVDRDTGTFVAAQKLNPTERAKKINSWSAAIALIAKAATNAIPGAKLLRALTAVENHELSNHLSVSKMSATDWAVSLVPPFTLVALQGVLRISFAKTRELNRG